jgi:Ca-activated chloride channel family protein
MTFAHPLLLFLLLLLPVLAWLKGKRGTPPAFVYSSVQLVRAMQNIHRSRFGGFLGSLRWLALALFIVALAQPRISKSTTEVKASGIDIAVALDLSGSMSIPDYIVDGQQSTRFHIAQAVLRKFILGRPNDRIGLVVFAVQAFIGSPMTLDHDYLIANLDRLDIGSIDGSRTAIGDGLTTAINRLRDLKSKSKIIVLMTDGGNNSGKTDPLTAAQVAKTLGVKIYTIGLGNAEIVRQLGGSPDDLPDTDVLGKIADLTGGKFYRANNTEELKAIYTEIDKLEKSEATISKYTEYKELFPWFVTCGLALLLIEIVLSQTAFRKLP